MQRQLRTATLLASLGAAIILILLVLAAATGSMVLSLIAGFGGILVIFAGYFIVARALGKASNMINRLSSRLQKAETRQNNIATFESERVVMQEQLLGMHRQLKVLRNRVPAGYLKPVQNELREHRHNAQALIRTMFESAIQLGRDPRAVLTPTQAEELFEDYFSRNELLQLSPLIKNFNLLEHQKLSTLRRLFRIYRNTGYWDFASIVIEQLHEKSGLETDGQALEKLQHEIDVFVNPDQLSVELQEDSAYEPTGPILHVVGRVLPETQTGYTLRTQYTARAQRDKGLPVAIVGQSGITSLDVNDIEHYEFQGIDYYLLPGPVRNHVLLDDWLRQNIEQLAVLVREIRPSILHAQSDFFNSFIVNAVGTKYGIPTVYESRGFWEDSWLSRTIAANKWQDASSLFSMYGLPSAYEYRKRAEEVARILPDHVFTLAEVMRNHILDSAKGELENDAVTIVPNAVASDNFPVQQADLTLAAEVGLPEDAVTVGYISSMVEYEGIDTLLDAYQNANENSSRPMCLLLVGDGDYLPTLKEHVAKNGISNVYFTGRVPHEDVLRYYGLIDIFVVPRKPSTVADLVTPLKPFEAFSTGRAVILSDVAALREIADQSGAVELFRAGDANDLAQKISTLVHDTNRRQELSGRAARWVRNHRSWAHNVNEYYRVYRELGYRGPENLVVEAELSLEGGGINPGELLESLTAAELPPLRGWFTIQDIKQSATSILKDGWRFGKFEPVLVSEIDDWASYGAEHRSWGFHLHAWEFMDPLLREYDETGEIQWLNAAVRIAISWVKIQRDVQDSEDPMVWYDMSLSLRTPRLIALTLRAARVQENRDEAVILAAAIGDHFDELHKDRAFNPNNNHDTAVSQVHAAKYAPMFHEAEPTRVEGRERLAQMAASQFAADGTHLEHSPDYHRMLLNSFEMAVKDNLIEDEDIKKRVERAAHVLGWMVQPDGALVQFGDSPETLMVKPDAESIDAQTQYVLSDGVRGEKPTEELAVYPDGGYAFVRSPQPDFPGTLHKSGYLAFSAAFHSRAHKHADDLNVVWYDRCQPILVDAGRFGYGDLLPQSSPLRSEGFYYAALERQFVEGTMAHNTLMMDGQNQDRRARKPYGSGIGKCVESNGIFDLTGRVQHVDYVHRRRLIYEPGNELRLMDSVYSQSPEQREATIWLNIAGHFELESIGDFVVFSSDANGERTYISIEGPGRLVKPVRGQNAPMRGWRSRHDRALEPTWSVGFTFQIETRASVATRLKFVDSAGE